MARFHKKSAAQFIYGIVEGVWHCLHFQNLGLRIKHDFAVLGPKAFDGIGNRGMSDNIWWALQEKVVIARVSGWGRYSRGCMLVSHRITGIAFEFLDGMAHGPRGIAEGAICNEGGRIDD